MNLYRQDAKTEISELYGLVCESLLTFHSEEENDAMAGIYYLKASDIWHRFFIDEGVLFWNGDCTPDPEDDLGPGEDYIDLAKISGYAGQEITEIQMAREVLTIRFSGGQVLKIREGIKEQELILLPILK